MRSHLITSLAAVAALGLVAPAFAADSQAGAMPSASAKMKGDTQTRAGVNAVKSKCTNPPLNTIPKDCVADTDLNAGLTASTPGATTDLNASTGASGSTYSQPSDSSMSSPPSTSSSASAAKPAPAKKPSATSTPTQ